MQPNFSSTIGLTLNSSGTTATGDGTVLRLATANDFDAGSAFTTATRSVASGFSTSFNFRLTSSGGITDSTGAAGADGLAFVVQRSGASALGATGEGFGYLGIGNSVAVEFDTFLNSNRGDPNSNHVGVNTAGSVTSVATANVTPAFDNGNKWTAWVDYNGSVLEVRVSTNGIRPASPLLAHSIDIATTIGGGTAFVGFTSATGAAYSNHDLLGWAFAEKFLAGGLTIYSWSGSGSWSDTARWNPAAIPGASDIALVSAGVANVTDPRSVGTLQFSGGTLGGSGTLTLTEAGSIWSGGTMIGTGTLRVAAGASLEIANSINHDFSRSDGVNSSGGRIIENSGQIRWLAGNLRGGDGAAFVNTSTGLLEISSGGLFTHSGVGNTPSFANAGIVRKTAGATTTFASTAVTNTGTFEVQSGTLEFTSGVTANAGTFTAAAGALLTFSGGQTFNTGTAFTGAGSIRLDAGTSTLSGNLTSQNLTFAGGTLQGTGTLTGSLVWTGGAWSGNGTLTLAASGNLAISGAAQKTFNRADGVNSSGGRTIENFGSILWTGTGNLLGGDGAQIVNRTGATFLIQNDATLGFTGGGATPSFLNQGTFRKNTTGGTTTVAQTQFTNAGTVDVQTGTLAFTSGVISNAGTFQAASGASLTFSGGQTFNNLTVFQGIGGNIRITAGDTTMAGTLTSAGLEFAGGSLYGTAAIGGAMTWTGGNWRSDGIVTFLPGSTLTLAGASAKTLSRNDGVNSTGGRILRSSGTVAWTDTGGIIGNDGAGIELLAGGVFELQSNAAFTHGGGGAIPFFTNAGTVRKLASAGTSTFDNVAFTNTGHLEILGGNVLFSGGSGGAGLGNAGTVTVQAGTLTSSAAGRTSTGGSFDVFAGALLRFTGGTNTINSSAFTGLGLTEIAGGTLVVSGSTIGGHVQLTSGTVGGGGMFTVESGGRFTWLGGSLKDTGTLAVAMGGQLVISGAASKTFVRQDGVNSSGGRTISNAGLTTWSGTGSILGGDGATFANLASGTFDAQSDALFGHSGAGNAPSFNNDGTFRKTAGPGVTALALAFTNAGILESKSGTLRLTVGGSGAGQFIADGGTIDFASNYTLNDGARLLGPTLSKLTAGIVNVPGGSTATLGATGVGNFSLEGGTLGGGGAFLVGHLGNFFWSGGTMTGTGTLRVAVGGTLEIANPINHDFSRSDGVNSSGGRIIENSGQVRWLAGNLRGGDGAAFVNTSTGLLEISSGGLFTHSGAGNTPSFANAGIVRKTAGATTTFASTAVTNTGTFEVQSGTLAFTSGVTANAGTFTAAAGALLTFSGGQTFNTGTAFTGAGSIRLDAGTSTLAGNLTSQNLTFAGGTLQGNSTLTGSLVWTGGAWSGNGTLTLAAGSNLAISGSAQKTFNRADGVNSSGGRTIENFGSILWTGTGSLLGGDGAQIINRAGATFLLQNDATLGFTGGGVTPSFLNQGTFRKDTAGGTTTVAQTHFTNAGTVDVQSGTLAFTAAVTSSAGTFHAASGAALTFAGGQTFSSGTTFAGTGTTRVEGGTTTVAGTLQLANFEFAGGSLLGTATVTGGVFTWTGGDLRGANTLTIGAGAALRLSGSGHRTFGRADGINSSGGRTIENLGLMVIENSGNLLGNDGAQLINRTGGIVDLRNDASIAHGGGGIVPTFTNEGTLAKTAGTGTSTIAIPFVNTGHIVVSSGSLAFTSSFTNTGGSMTLANGASFATTGTLDLGTAPLSGSGTITAAAVTAGGLVSPGSSPGTLTITGNLTLLHTSTTLMELGGPAQGVDYDFLSVGGSGALAGNLQLSFLNGFQWTMPANSTFTVLTAAGGLTGAFANVAPGQRLNIFDGTGSLQVNYGTGSLFAANSVVLSNFVAIPEPSTYALLGVGSVLVLLSLRRRRP